MSNRRAYDIVHSKHCSSARFQSKLLTTTALATCITLSASVMFAQEIIDLPGINVETTAPVVAPQPTPKPVVKPTSQPAPTPAPVAPQPVVSLAPEPVDFTITETVGTQSGSGSAGQSPYTDPDAPFKVDTLAGSKFPGSTLDTPRTVNTLSEELLETTNTTSVREIARTTPGISLGFGEGGSSYGDNLYIRGFKANNDIYVDGTRSSGVGITDTFGYEQVEVLKGPAGAIGGRGTTGGSVNLITKQATTENFTKINTRIGTSNMGRAELDSNYVVNDAFQIRLGAMYQESDVPGRDEVYDNRLGASVAMRYAPSDNLEVLFDAKHTQIDQMPDWGVPFSRDFGVPAPDLEQVDSDRSTFFGVPGRDFQEFTSDTGALTINYDISPDLKLSNTTRYTKNSNDYILTGPGRVDATNWTTGLGTKSLWSDTKIFTNSTTLSGKFDTGSIGHAFTFGIDYSKENRVQGGFNVANTEDYGVPITGRCTVSIITPDPYGAGCSVVGFKPTRQSKSSEVNIETVSAYVLDRIEINPKFFIDLGLRADNYKIDKTGADYAYEREDLMVNWNVAATYKPTDNSTIYASYGTSTNPSGQEVDGGGASYGGLDENGQTLAPEKNTSIEIGAKYELNDDLLISAALFRTTKDNAIENSGGRGAPSISTATGKYQIQGIELSAAGNVTDKLSIYSGLVMMDSEVLESRLTDSDGNSLVGLQLANTVHTSFNLTAQYEVNDALTIGGAAIYGGPQTMGSLAATGENELPSWWRADLFASYKLSDNASLQLNIENLFDETIYDTVYRAETFTYLAPGRSVSFGLSYEF